MMQFVARCVIPFVLLFVGTLARRLARRGKGDPRKDWFLGQELALTAIIAGVTQLLDKIVAIQPNVPMAAADVRALQDTGVFTAIAFILLFPVMSLHQEWDERDNSPGRQKIYLGIVSNGLGIILMAYFLLWVRS